MIYNEVRDTGTRRFTLNGNILEIRGRIPFKSTFEMDINLGELGAHSSVIWNRSNFFFRMSALTAIFIIFGIIGKISGLSTDQNFGSEIMWSAAVIASLIAAKCFKKVKYTQFKNKSEIVIFDVAQSGPDKARYDEFILAIRSVINSPRPEKLSD